MSCGNPGPSTDPQFRSQSLPSGLYMRDATTWTHLVGGEAAQWAWRGEGIPQGRGVRRLYLHGIQGRLWQERKAQRRD